MSAKQQFPIDPNLFSWPSESPRLYGSQCGQCGNVEFPVQPSCTRCCGTELERVELANRGTLWTWTIQGFLPKSPPYAGPETPETFRPYGVGYIELPNQVRVEARLTESDPNKLRIGMEMELVIEPFREDDQGNEILGFAFKPVSD